MNGIVVWARPQTDRLALLDVAVSRTGPGWFDPDSYQLARFFGCVGSQRQRFLKSRPVGDHMIRGQNEHGGCVIASHDPSSAERHCSSGVTFSGFSDDILFWKTPQQFANCALLFRVRQDQSAFIRNKTLKPGQRFFEQSLIGNEAQQLFGAGTAAQWPEAFTAAASENKRVYRGEHVKVGGSSESRKLPFLFPKRDVYGRRCLSRYPFQKLPSSFRLTRCLWSHGPRSGLAWA